MERSALGDTNMDHSKENLNPSEQQSLLAGTLKNRKASQYSILAKLKNLEALLEHGFVSQEEYEVRLRQLIDKLTGTEGSGGIPSPRSVSSPGRNALADDQVILSEVSEMGEELSDGFTSSSSSFCQMDSDSGKTIQRSRVLGKVVVPGSPPDFRRLPTESAIKHTFDLRTRSWSSTAIQVCIDDTPFARGGLRLVYHLLELPGEGTGSVPGEVGAVPRRPSRSPREAVSRHSPSSQPSRQGKAENPRGTVTSASSEVLDATSSLVPVYMATDSFTSNVCVDSTVSLPSNATAGPSQRQPEMRSASRVSYVGKVAIDPSETPDTYFRDVEMQAHCAYYARLFNSYNPPREVRFCRAWVVELVEREGSPLCAVEEYIPGSYKKHNNNYGFVSEDERNTPQAFSHFSYEASSRSMVIIDIQGVGDHYTDPQIHTVTGSDFGKGNLGRHGCAKFLSTHRCNSICRYLKLPSVNPRYDTEGTLPALPFMDTENILRRKFQESHYYESNPSLQRYISTHSRNNSELTQRDTAPTWILSDSTGAHAEIDERCTFNACSII